MTAQLIHHRTPECAGNALDYTATGRDLVLAGPIELQPDGLLNTLESADMIDGYDDLFSRQA